MDAVVVARFVEAAGDDPGEFRVPVQAKHRTRVPSV